MPAQGSKRNGRPVLTSRAAILGLVLCALVLTFAYPARIYLDQRREINQLEAAQTAQQQRVQGLRDELARQADPAYVEAQARERLRYVLPGETAYIIVDSSPGSGTPQGAAPSPTPSGSWLEALWGSLQRADAAPVSSPPSAPVPGRPGSGDGLPPEPTALPTALPSPVITAPPLRPEAAVTPHR